MKPSRLVTSGGVRRHTVRGMRRITKAALVRTAAALAVAGAALAATTGIAHADSGAPSVTYVHWVGADCIAVATAASDPTLATTRSVCGGMWRWSEGNIWPGDLFGADPVMGHAAWIECWISRNGRVVWSDSASAGDGTDVTCLRRAT